MEKTRQLGLMGHIYKEAARIVVWLGPGYWNMGHGLYQLKKMLAGQDEGKGQDRKQLPRNIRDLDSDEEPDALWYGPATRGAFRIGLARALNKDWWGRLWVVQEIVLSKNAILYCGNRRIPWRTTSH